MKTKLITLFVSDIDESMKFYQGHLGFEVSRKISIEDKEIIFLENQSDVHLELIERKKEQYHKSQNKNFSIGIEVENLEDLVEELKGYGYKVKGPIQPGQNHKFYFVSDKDGFVIQLL